MLPLLRSLTVLEKQEPNVVLRATEGWTPGLPGHERDVVPVYSLVSATEPLPASIQPTARELPRATSAAATGRASSSGPSTTVIAT